MDKPGAPPGVVEKRLAIGADEIALWDRPGDGAPIVLVHGNSCSKESFAPLIAADGLKGRRLVALDLPGCGESSDAADPTDTYTLPGLADVVIGVIRALDLERPIVVGWSLGGHIAIDALNRGGDFAGLVLTGTPPCGPDPAEIAATFLPVPGAEVMAAVAPPPEALSAWTDAIFAPSPVTDALRRAVRRADGRMRGRIFEHIFATPDSRPQRATVAAWKRPILVLQGRDEPFFDPKALAGLAWGHLWRGACQWIDGAGHAPFYTRPAAYGETLEAFARDIET